MSRRYSIYIELPGKSRSGDATVISYDGRYRTFAWGVGAWRKVGMVAQRIALEEWLIEIEDSLGITLDEADTWAIITAVMDNVMKSEE